MLMCERCKHQPVCAIQKDMVKLKMELEEKEKLIEYKHFRINLECEHYFDGALICDLSSSLGRRK